VELPLVLNQIDLIQHQCFHEQFISFVLLQPVYGLLKQVIEFFGTVDDQKGEVYVVEHFPSFG
jgi:hypothetical protein